MEVDDGGHVCQEIAQPAADSFAVALWTCCGFKSVQRPGILDIASPAARVPATPWFEFCSAHYGSIDSALKQYFALPMQPRDARRAFSTPWSMGDIL